MGDSDDVTLGAADNLDVTLLHESLTTINNFAKRKNDQKLPPGMYVTC